MDNYSEPSSPDDFKLAYLSRCSFEEGKTYRGGVLIIDRRGTPLEFRCTSAIRPNPVQRTLYGDSLDPYMQIELVGKPLLGAIREAFDMLVVDDPCLLDLRKECGRAVVYVRRQGEEFGRHSAREGARAGLVDSPAGRFDPVVVEAAPDTAEDVSSAMTLFEKVASTFDPLEPFQRIQRALDKVHEQKTLD